MKTAKLRAVDGAKVATFDDVQKEINAIMGLLMQRKPAPLGRAQQLAKQWQRLAALGPTRHVLDGDARYIGEMCARMQACIQQQRPPEVYTERDVGELLGISEAAARRLIATQMTHYDLGKRTKRVKRPVFWEWLFVALVRAVQLPKFVAGPRRRRRSRLEVVGK